MLVPHLWILPSRITAIIKLCNLAWNTWHRNGWAPRLPLFSFINSKVMCHFVVQVVQEHFHTQSGNSYFREDQAQPGLQPASKELSWPGPGLPWPLLSCTSWSLTLAAETQDSRNPLQRGVERPTACLCASSSVHMPAVMVEPQAGHSSHTSKCTSSRTCPLGRPRPLPDNSQARRGPLRTASASSNSGQQRHLCFRFSGSLSEPESKDPVKTL